MEEVSFIAQTRATIKKYLKWYSFPLIYFLITSLLCAYAWYTRSTLYRAGIKTVFKTIALVPGLLLTGAVTASIIIAILLIPLSFWLKKMFPDRSVSEAARREPSLDSTPIRFRIKTVNLAISVLGVALIVAGLSIAAWISRPYIAFLFATSKIEALEKKAESLGQAQGDLTRKSETGEKIAEFLKKKQDVETTEKRVSEQKSYVPQKVSGAAGSVAVSAKPGDAGQVQRGESRKSGVLSSMAEFLRKGVIKKSEMLEKRADGVSPSSENRIIIPAALVDAPILEGVDMEKLSEGVCHVPKSSVPGQGGNCIIEGHNLGEFGWWRPKGRFSMLEIMEKGIPIYVFYKGKKYIYRAKKKIYTDVNDPKLYDFSPGERLTLLTCTSSWDITVYTTKRTVIIAYPE